MGVALTGCAGQDSKSQVDTSHVLESALKSARALRASYSRAVDNGALSSAEETLSTLRAHHQEHVEALAKILRESADEEASPLEGDLKDGALDTLLEGEENARAEALDSCVNSPKDFAVLLAEITACRASHIDALKELS